ncbi:MAG: hypothetical protein ACRYFR_05150 [Janthinobacterium lividum]
MKKNKNLIIAPCGNSSTVFATDWLKDAEAKEFDVCLLFYHAEIKEPSLYEGVEYFYHLKDFKFRMIHNLLTAVAPNLLDEYEYFYFIDDDVALDTAAINRMFTMSKLFDTWVSQASLSQDSFCSWPILKNKASCVLRFMGQVEVMAPLFSRAALRQCLVSFNENKSSWGMDSVWPKILGYPTNKLAVFDDVVMVHTRPVGGGELYAKIKADPNEEWDSIIKKYDAIKDNFVEHGRLEYVTTEHNPMVQKAYKSREQLGRLRQRIRDKGLLAELRSQIGINPD